MADDQRLPLNRVSGSGFAPGQAPVWDGRTFKPGSAGDSNHAGAAFRSTEVGTNATASGGAGTAVGDGAAAAGTSSSAFGTASASSGQNSTSIGDSSVAAGALSTALGTGAYATGEQAIALGCGAEATVDHRCLIKANEVEVEATDGTGTSIILEDTATGTRYRLSVTNGALSITAA